jgi:hypothetical protein
VSQIRTALKDCGQSLRHYAHPTMGKAKRLREEKKQRLEQERKVAGATASLDGPLAKLGRAKAHFDALNGSIEAFQRSDTHDIVITKSDSQTGEKVANLRILKHPKNPEWGLILGDMVHNLRSALDHLVWQLVILNGEKPRRQNQFPIIGAKAQYLDVQPNRSESARDRMLVGVAEPHRAFIDVVQPFNGRQDASEGTRTALSLLSSISNTDKHRVVHAGFALIEEPTPDLFDASSPQGEVAVDISMNWGELEDGAEIMRFRPDPPGAQVNMKATIPMHLAFRHGGRDLRPEHFQIVFDWVDSYVRGFAPIFDGELRMDDGSPIKVIGPVPGT